MNNLNSVRNFVLLPNGFFFSPIGSSYFCGRYLGEDCPPQPVSIELPFPFNRLFVDYYRGELRVNHELVHYRYSHLSTPPLPLYLGGESHERLGRFEKIKYLLVAGGFLSANGVAIRLHDFPLSRFELSVVDIERANNFLSLGYTKVGFVYAWYKPFFFLEFNENWMTFYLRVGCGLGIGW